MSKKNQSKKTPTYRIYSVIQEGEKTIWHELGAAWKHEKDGKGYTLQFKALPLPGAQVVLREPLPPKTEG